MTVATEFNLNDEVRAVLAKAGIRPDYDQVAKDVVARIPSSEIADVLLTLVRKQVQLLNGSERRKAMLATAQTCVARKKLVLPAAGTSRWERAVPAWQRLLDTNVNIGRGSMPKRLGSCSAAEVLAVATARFSQSASVKAEGTRFAKLHEVMLVEGAATPDDLSQATLIRFAQGWPT